MSLLLNDKKLVKGKDYEWDGARLTFKASLLSSIAQSGELGTNAVLTAKFNRGADWQFNVITYEKPVVTNSTGTTTDFRIPTVFNGDSLATMEAVYSDGSYAGPQNWTSFKEFGYAFSPDYKTNDIILTERFFNEVQDGEVLLTLHFWSGETLTYTLLKNGNQVTGSYDDKPDTPDDKEEVPEVEEEPAIENNPPSNEDGAPINDEETKTTDDLIRDETTNLIEETPTSNEKPMTQIEENNNVQPISHVKDTDVKRTNEGNLLPSTATGHYNLLAIGFLLLIGGSVFLLTKQLKLNK
ncbi:X2-like carbohydrate binding domain-containing protein [Metabacillus niabensis]|uniref:X2-like carbohydrate binding domain-containing protein n=1 Tax=Metabacillus niabensis TaxID=324854 RepID=UPI0039A2C325